MRIRVKQAVLEQLLEVGPVDQLIDLLGVMASRAQRGQIGHLDSRNKLEHQDSVRGELMKDFWNVNAGPVSEVVPELVGACGLALVIHLLVNDPGELVNVDEPVGSGEKLWVAAHEAAEPPQQFEVKCYCLLEPRPLDFDSDIFSSDQS